MSVKKQIVVLGAGYAGMGVAAQLEKSALCEVTVVSPRAGFLFNKITALRAVVVGDGW